MNPLPIDDALPRLLDVLRDGNAAVLQAPPGAGKTTRVPLALHAQPWLAGARIIMLEPRRLATRAAARRMAATLGEPVGKTIGYRMRMETVVSAATRIEVVTEGILVRMLQSDAALEGVGALIFDEFHERSLQSDLGLALSLQSQATLRDDLRILVMSATLDGEGVSRILNDAPIITSVGRSFPVDVRYLPKRLDERLEAACVSAVRRVLTDETGDILAFLPGAGEIRRVDDALRAASIGANVDIAPLYGNLTQSQQDVAIAPSRDGRRKVVLSTSIAETSLTIEGIRSVIDCGVMRVPRFSPRSGMTRLETVRVTQSSAEQRRGRAGRIGPGVCYRLWNEIEQQHLLPHGQPEILEADLAPLALELAVWRVSDPLDLRWLDAPPLAAYTQARELLRELGALDANGAITEHGRRMSEIPLHPRLAHMVLRAVELGVVSLACDIAALLSERDVFRSSQGGSDVDLRLRLEAIRRVGDISAVDALIDRAAVQRVRSVARIIRERIGNRTDVRAHRGESAASTDTSDRRDIEATGVLLALAYPDRIAAMREGQRGRFLLRNGRAAVVNAVHPLAANEFIVIADLDGGQNESRVYLAAPIDRDSIDEHFVDQFDHRDVVTWEENGIRARRITRLGALVLRDVIIADPDPDAVIDALLLWIQSNGIGALAWTKFGRALQERIQFVRHHSDEWPDVSDANLMGSVDAWLRPLLHDVRRRADLARIDVHSVLLSMLSWEQRRQLDQLAPTHVDVPSGSHIPIDYAVPDSPTLSVRLQEMFGATETPRIFGGRVPLTLHLLSPAGRPAQVTRDLASFWQTGYFDVRKDLRGRYPKHYWPDDPLQAEPTRRTKRTSP